MVIFKVLFAYNSVICVMNFAGWFILGIFFERLENCCHSLAGNLEQTLALRYITMFFLSQNDPMGHWHQKLIDVSLFNFYIIIFVIALFLTNK